MNPDYGSLLTDLYQFTMLQGYWQHAMYETAVFEFFARNLPQRRNFLVAAGLEQAIEYLEKLAFSPADLEWLRQTQHFHPEFVCWLEKMRFTGDVNAMPEGTVFFADEPILQVIAPLPEAQFVETRLINLLNFQTTVASKAARSVLVAQNKLLVDFGLRRAHGAEAGLMAARATYLAGFGGTSTVLAGQRFNVPIYGTMAHSFVQAHADEMAAFARFADSNPGNVVLLIDTYDTEAAAEKVVRLAPQLKQRGIAVQAVRIDSGDLGSHARKVRQILDNGGLGDVRIFASGNLDENILCDLIEDGAPIDGFGVGTRLDTSSDAPYLDCAYKLQQYGGRPCRKRSEGKTTWPGRKQVYRAFDAAGGMTGDVLALYDERQEGEPLLHPVLRGGRRLDAPVPLSASRDRAARQLERLPEPLRKLDQARQTFKVKISSGLQSLALAVDEPEPLRGLNL
jgi:nicotinate phosphoribosyltransferase